MQFDGFKLVDFLIYNLLFIFEAFNILTFNVPCISEDFIEIKITKVRFLISDFFVASEKVL